MIRRCFSWVEPQIGILPGFLNIYTVDNNFVNGADLVIGQPYTLDIRMTDTDRYDYLLQSCTYNDKYHFIDQNSCLVCDKFFRQKWENDKYRLQGAFKRTVVHFLPPEPLVRLDCSVRVLECCGCAERACERNVLPALTTYPQQLVNLAIISESPSGLFGNSVALWPWWAWLLIICGLFLLFCLLSLLLLLCSRYCQRKRKVADSQLEVPRPSPIEAPRMLALSKELETNGTSKTDSKRPQVPASPSIQVHRSPSEPQSENALSVISQSRAATIVKQERPNARWQEIGDPSVLGTKRFVPEQHAGTRHLEELNEIREHISGYRNIAESGSRFRGNYLPDQRNVTEMAHFAPGRTHHTLHQQTTSEEKFFKKCNRQGGLVEEGYDQAQITYTTPLTRYSHSKII